MVSTIHNISFDAADPYELAQFWSKVTGRPVHEDDKPGSAEVLIELANGTNLFFQRVPEPKTVKNRVHVCLQPDSTRDEELDRVLALGAKLAEDFRNTDGTGWVVTTPRATSSASNVVRPNVGSSQRSRLSDNRISTTS